MANPHSTPDRDKAKTTGRQLTHVTARIGEYPSMNDLFRGRQTGEVFQAD